MQNASEELEVDKAEVGLTQLILSLELAPANIVSVGSLMSRLGLGRTPIRLALERLSEQGLVTCVPGRGFIVSPLSLADFADQYEFAAEVDGAASRLAAKRITGDELDQLEAIVARGEEETKDGDHQRYVELDREFHALIAHASGNRGVAQISRRLYSQLQRYSAVSIPRRIRRTGAALAEIWQTEMRRIVSALRARDPEEAERSMRAHMLASKERTKEYL